MRSIGRRNSLLLVTVAIVLVFGLVFARFTGFAVSSQSASVTRAITPLGDGQYKVVLKINSNVKLIAVSENFTGSVTNYTISPGFDVFEFKDSEKTWIIGDRNLTINGNLAYYATASGNIGGIFSYFSGDSLIVGNISGDADFKLSATDINAQFLNKAYIYLLHRSIDSAGLQYWSDRMNKGLTQDGFFLEAYKSTEYQTKNKIDSMDNSAFIKFMYSDWLLRNLNLSNAGDLAGYNYWKKQLDSGALNREGIAKAFISSTEFKQKFNAFKV